MAAAEIGLGLLLTDIRNAAKGGSRAV